MKKEFLIKNLILQDLRHMQMVYGLEAIGYHEEVFHSLELSDCIAESALSIYSHFQKL